MRDFSELVDDFSFLDDWEDRYRYVIELGRELADLEDSQRTEANKVHGCASQVWLITDVDTWFRQARVLNFKGDSDALIVKGLIAILISIYSANRPTRSPRWMPSRCWRRSICNRTSPNSAQTAFRPWFSASTQKPPRPWPPRGSRAWPPSAPRPKACGLPNCPLQNSAGPER